MDPVSSIPLGRLLCDTHLGGLRVLWLARVSCVSLMSGA